MFAMRPIKIGFHSYRRLADAAMSLDARILAIVGPNEAGKSSVLDALLAFNDEDALAATDLTRGREVQPRGPVLGLTLLLDAEDHAVLSEVPEAEDCRYFYVEKWRDGTLAADARPWPKRHARQREQGAKAIEALANSSWFKSTFLDDDGAERIATALAMASEALRSDTESIDHEALTEIRQLVDEIEGEEPSKPRVLTCLRTLREALDYEAREHPRDRARRILLDRLPTFAFFSEEARVLGSSYDLNIVAANPPFALKNLSALAGLDLTELHRAIQDGRYGDKETLLDRANARLAEVFGRAWTQGPLTVRLQSDETHLRLYVRREGDQLSSIAEHSDGLRTYVALIAFLAGRSDPSEPVLLIDEAEQHLHYDAQADLVRMLSRQRETRQVIYTTHSAGCLPDDLGAGVRVVTPIPDSERSVCRNAFYEDDSTGFDSLLLAMGAATFAFSSARYAVLTEGACDLILLPRLFREVTGGADAGFQVAPGLAHVARGGPDGWRLVAARVAYLVDNDDGGDEIAKLLVKNSVPKERICRLAIRRVARNTLEDLLDEGVYLDAVNEELRRSHGDKIRVARSDLAIPRPRSVAACCRKQGVDPPNKAAVARRLLELDDGTRALLSTAGRNAITKALGELKEILGLDADQ
jgi:hypothetical protein